MKIIHVLEPILREQFFNAKGQQYYLLKELMRLIAEVCNPCVDKAANLKYQL